MGLNRIDGEIPVFGLDIGTRSVVGTVGYKKDDRFVVAAQEIREHQTRSMLDGQIHDINRVAATISEVKKALEEKVGFELTEASIAAAGRVLKTLNVFAKLDFESERNVTKEDMKTLASIGVEQAFDEFQKTEDSKTHFYCVGYSIVKYYLNNMWIGEPEHHKANSIGADMIATFLPDDVVDGLYSAVELAGLKVANMTLEPIAAIRVAIPEKYRLLNIAMIDVGAGTSDISVTNDGSVTAFGMIPCAGDSITEALARECLIDFATAERIKTSISEEDTVTYEDIMGIEESISKEQVLNLVNPQISHMAKLAADEIKRLNGGNIPSAVFVVGGGGKIAGFTEMVAEELGLDPKRVALRGESILREVDFPEGAKVDSTIVTPIGICLSYYEQNNNFMYVTFNGQSIKLFDNNHLAVVDAAISSAFDKEDLFPRRGDEIHYTVNGKQRVSKGEYGDSARVFVNGEEVNLNYAIKANDDIIMEPSTKGKSAIVKICDLADFNSKLKVTIDGEEVILDKPIKVNGMPVNKDYVIKDNDIVNLYSYYTHEQIMDFLHVLDTDTKLIQNGEEAALDSPVYAGDEIVLQEREYERKAVTENFFEDSYKDTRVDISIDKRQEDQAEAESVSVFKEMIKDAAKEEEENKKVLVMVNQKPVALEGKDSYMFVDIFDYINFDTSKMQGKGIVTLVNGENAQYTQKLNNGDKIEVYWS